jgi:hypothetical protein
MPSIVISPRLKAAVLRFAKAILAAVLPVAYLAYTSHAGLKAGVAAVVTAAIMAAEKYLNWSPTPTPPGAIA